MENTEDAENWRDSFTKDLEKINIKVLNPTRPMFHDQLSESEDMRNKFKKMRENNEFSELHDIMKNIIRRDLRAVDLSTFVIVKLEPNKATWGTTHEVIQASSQRKPIFFMINKRSEMPLWLVGLVNMDFVFENKEELFKAIFDLDSGKRDMDSKYWKILLS
jgi:hypothetical protein